jgi:hypothetical protein
MARDASTIAKAIALVGVAPACVPPRLSGSASSIGTASS